VDPAGVDQRPVTNDAGSLRERRSLKASKENAMSKPIVLSLLLMLGCSIGANPAGAGALTNTVELVTPDQAGIGTTDLSALRRFARRGGVARGGMVGRHAVAVGPPGAAAVRRTTVVGSRGKVAVRRTIAARPYRPWVRASGTVIGGVALGTLIAASAVTGPSGAGSPVRVVRVTCDSAPCTVECGHEEVLVTAYCGARRAPAIFPTEHSASCHGRGIASDHLVATCAKVSMQSAAPVTPQPQLAAAEARDFPNLNVGPNCRSASDRQKCMADEQTAREQLVREWEQFARGDKASCTQTVSDIAGSQSYVELLTCLEMARDARKLPKE
jgi:hypothetical protein